MKSPHFEVFSRKQDATGPNRAAASGRLRADRAGAFTGQYSKQCDSFMIWFISIHNTFTKQFF